MTGQKSRLGSNPLDWIRPTSGKINAVDLQEISPDEPEPPRPHTRLEIIDMVKNNRITLEQGLKFIKEIDFTREESKPSTREKEKFETLYFLEYWEESRLNPEDLKGELSGHYVVFDTRADRFHAIRERLKTHRGTIVLVTPGKVFRETDKENHIYEIDPGEPIHYGLLLKSLRHYGLNPGKILHLWAWNQGKTLKEQLRRGIYSIFHLSRALLEQESQAGVRLVYVFPAPPAGGPPHDEAISGFARTLRIENPGFVYKTAAIETGPGFPLDELLAELEPGQTGAAGTAEIKYQYHDQAWKRLVKGFREIKPGSAGDKNKPLPIKENGVYMVTGGTGGLGLILAEYLVKQAKIKLVLTGRALYSQLNPDIRERIKQLENVEGSAGTEVVYIQSDVSKPGDVDKLAAQVRSRFKDINGLIHCAGVTRDAFIRGKKPQDMDDVLGAKVYGTVHLDNIFKEEKLDFFLLFSSLAAVMGNAGQGDYAFANCFMDRFAGKRERLRESGERWGKTLAIDWPFWQEGGIRVSEFNRKIIAAQTGLEPMPTRAGLDAMENVYALHYPHCTVAYGRREKIKSLADQNFSLLRKPRGMIEAEARGSTLGADGVDSDDAVNSALLFEKTAGFLKNLFAGILELSPGQIDMETRFERYGIDSIIVNMFNAKIEKELCPIPKTLLFEYQTLEQLTRYFAVNHGRALARFFHLESVYESKPHPASNENNKKFLQGGPNQSVSGSAGQLDDLQVQLGNPLTTIPRPHPGTNENQHKRFAQHIGSPRRGAPGRRGQDDIAVIGISGRYPLAGNLEEYWENLKQGIDCITEIPAERWDYREYYDPEPGKGMIYVKCGGFLEDIDRFDPLLFNISPREAELLDPQERIFLETVWSLLEDAGYTRKDAGPEVGVFAGVTTYTYHLLGPGGIRAESLPMPWSIANRVSFVFNFHGPSMPVDTACSSSLTAVHLACESLRKQECRMAAAGGVNLYLHPAKYLGMCWKRMLSVTGRCHAFGAGGDGFIPGEGVGAVLLKPLDAALADNDHIYAVIKGSAVNHGGRTNGYTVPNPNAQADLILQALRKVRLDPRTISYVEAHGTGTALGDPVEIQGLSKAYQEYTREKQFCSIGSVKSNIGHLESAAGIAGLTKIILQMKHRQLVPSLHARKLNPNIDFQISPFYVQQELSQWKQPHPLRAGISSFGAGGANAHVILEEAPQAAQLSLRRPGGSFEKPPVKHPEPPQNFLLEQDFVKSTVSQGTIPATPYLILLSAQNQERLKAYAGKMKHFLEKVYFPLPGDSQTGGKYIEKIQGELIKLASNIIHVEQSEIDVTEELAEQGFDAIHLTKLIDRINDAYGLDLTAVRASGYSSIDSLAGYLWTEHKECLKNRHLDIDVGIDNIKGNRDEGIVEDRPGEEKPDLVDIAYTLQLGREAMDQRIAMVASNHRELCDRLSQYYQDKPVDNITGFYSGNIKTNRMMPGDLFKDQSGEQHLLSLVKNRDLDRLAQLWVLGVRIDWRLLYPDREPKRVSLPTYAFARQRCWLPTNESAVNINLPGSRAPQRQGNDFYVHPLVHRNTSTFREQKFTSRVTGQEFYLADHVIAGQKVLPGVAYIEMARAAGEISGEKQVGKIKNIIWARPVTVDTGPLDLSIRLYPGEDNGRFVDYEIYSSPEPGAAEVLHSRGQLVYRDRLPVDTIDIKAIKGRCTTNWDGAACTRIFQEKGFQYGESFQPIVKLYFNREGTETLSYLRLPSPIEKDSDRFVLHPSLMDGALQTVAGLMAGVMTDINTPYLPFTLGEVEIIKPLTRNCYAYAVPIDPGKVGADPTVKKFNIQLADEDGQVLVNMKNYSMRVLRPQGDVNASQETKIYFHSAWEECAAVGTRDIGSLAQSHVLLFDVDRQLWESLKKTVSRVTLVKPGKGYKEVQGIYEVNPGEPGDYRRLVESLEQQDLSLDRIIHMWSKGDFSIDEETLRFQPERGIYPVFYLSQVLMEQKPKDKIKLLYVYSCRDDGSQPLQAAISGFARTIRRENTKFVYKTVELRTDPGVPLLTGSPGLAEFLYRELDTSTEGDVEVLYDGEKRMIRRFRQLDMQKPGKHPVQLKLNGVYIITGGMGKLGLIFAGYLAQRVKARLVLTDCCDLNEEKEQRIKQLESLGSEVLFIKADISRGREVEELVKEVKARFGGIQGIFHAAGVIRDAYIINKTKEQVEAVLAPKVQGTIWLDLATKDEPLDFFILFSSTAGLFGNPGQSDYAYANCFMDNFAKNRERLRVKGEWQGKSLSINWSLWKQGGMRVDDETAAWMESKFGRVMIETTDGLEAFEKFLTLDNIQAAFAVGKKAQLEELLGIKVSAGPVSVRGVDGISEPMESPEPGNIQRKSLQSQSQSKSPARLQERVQRDLVQLCVELLKVKESDLDIEEELGNYGLDSIMMMTMLNRLEEMYGAVVEPSALAEQGSIKRLASYLIEQGVVKAETWGHDAGFSAGDDEKKGSHELHELTRINKSFCRGSRGTVFSKRVPLVAEGRSNNIAVIGMACRFPRSNSLEEYWDNLKRGQHLVTEVPADRWDMAEYFDPDKTVENKSYSKWGAFLEDVYSFDASYFGISEEDALVMDPHHRILLELVAELFHRSGYTKEEMKGTLTGVYIGGGDSGYGNKHRDKMPGNYLRHFVVNTSQNMMAARLSDFYDLQGPSQVIDTACSSALVAIHQACRAIRDGECNAAIAGGIELILDPHVHIGFSKAGVLSDDGVCYVFDEKAGGFVLGEGAGIVLLKSYEAALADGDEILAVISGSAVNNDGHTMGLTVPGIEGQRRVIRQALENSGVSAGSISYLEAHGTGTLLGDPIEIRAASRVYEEFTRDKQYCAVGSVKSNLGHLLRAAGIAGFIKVVLALMHKTIPPTIHCTRAHPRFRFEDSPFYPIMQAKEWQPRDNTRCAAISSFGFGGTNCHMIVQEFVDNGNLGYVKKRQAFPLPRFKRKRCCLGEDIGEDKQEDYPFIVSRVFTYDEPFLHAHVIFGKQVLLGVTFCSLVIDAAEKVLYNEDSMVHLHKFLFLQPIIVGRGEQVEVGVCQEQEQGDGRQKFKILYKELSPADSRYTTACVCEAMAVPGIEPLKVNIDRFRQHPDRVISDEFFSGKRLLDSPPCLRVVKRAYVLGDEVLGELEMTPEVENAVKGFHVSPALLNAGFTVGVCLQPEEVLLQDDVDAMWIPFMIKDIYVYDHRVIPGRCYCHARVLKVDSQLLVMNFSLCDEDGRVLLAVHEFTLRYMVKNEFSREQTGTESAAFKRVAPQPSRFIVPDTGSIDLEKGIENYLVNKVTTLLGYASLSPGEAKSKNFMELGVDSNSLIVLSGEIENELGIQLYPTLFFEYQDVGELTGYFMAEHREVFSRYLQIFPGDINYKLQNTNYKPSPIKSFCGGPGGGFFKKSPLVAEGKDIAIIGMAGRFAGSPGLGVFWENLRTGKDLITEIPFDHWDWRPWFDENREAPNKTYCKWGSFIEVDKFDPLFFGIPPREAVWLDPQFRVLVEIVHGAIEDAGYGQRIGGTGTGVFVGVSYHDYWDEIVRAHRPLVDYQVNSCFLCSLAGRISYTFDLQGQNLPVDNACASSLTAVHLACQAVRSGECEMAFAAGTNLLLSPLHYVNFARTQALSPTGRCRSFDKDADGYVPGEGAAAILLKPLDKALRDNDNIHAVIKGTATNHGGRANNPTSPRPELQTRVLVKAWEAAGIPAETITYIEAHGTGTILGDPIEINALKKAFGRFTTKKGFCGIGTAKAHIGHLEGAAGIAGIIKTILSMKNRQIPAMPGFKELNPYIDLEDSPFYINTKPQSWAVGAGVPRRAGVSSFGMTGSNTHVVLEEYVPPGPGKSKTGGIEVLTQIPGIFVLSARNEERLKAYAREMLNFLENNEISLVDVVYTLQSGRKAMEERLAVVIHDIEELEEALDQYCRGKSKKEEDIENLYRGNTGVHQAKYELLLEGEEGREYIRSLIDHKKFHKLARLWVSGTDIDWKLLYGDNLRRCISLPTYPFAGESYWVPVEDNYRLAGSGGIGSGEASHLHPLLHGVDFEASFNLGQGSGFVFETCLKPDIPLLAHHRVGGRSVLPGVAHVEMVTAAVKQVRPFQPFVIEQLVWVRPLVVTEAQKIRVVLRWKSGDKPGGNGNEDVRCEIFGSSGVGDGEPLVYSRSRIRFVPAAAGDKAEIIDVNGLKQTLTLRWQDPEAKMHFYDSFSQLGIDYGEYFQGVSSLWGSHQEALGLVRLAATYSSELEHYHLHPGLLDSALQCCAGTGDSRADRAYLPYSIGEITVFQELTSISTIYAYARKVPDQDQCYDVALLNREGQVCVTCRDFIMRPMKQDRERAREQVESLTALDTRESVDPVEDLLYFPVWVREPLPAAATAARSANADSCKAKTLLIYHDHSFGLEKHLMESPGAGSKDNYLCVWLSRGKKKQKHQGKDNLWQVNIEDPAGILECFAKLPGFDRVYFLGGLDSKAGEKNTLAPAFLEERQMLGVIAWFRCIKALLELGYGEKALELVVVTQDCHRLCRGDAVDPGPAGLIGLTRSLAKEYPHWQIKSLDFSREALRDTRTHPGLVRGIREEPPSANGASVAFRHQWRYVMKLMHFILPAVSRCSFRQQGVYVILGGAGGIGHALSKYLVKHYQAQMVWIDRQPLDQDIQNKIRQVAQEGPAPVYIQADATQLQNMKTAASRIKKQFRQIHGVIHSAIVLKDQTLANMSEAGFQAALHPKVQGSIILAEVFKGAALDWFCFFSSAQSFTGAPGQSNYAAACTFKDAFAHALRQQASFPVHIINWGYWGSVGIVANDSYRDRLAKLGGYSLEPGEGIEIIERVLARGIDQIVPMKIAGFAEPGMGVDSGYQIAVYPDTQPSYFQTVTRQVPDRSSQLQAIAGQRAAYEALEGFTLEGMMAALWRLGLFTGLSPGKAVEIPGLKQDLGIIDKYERLFRELLRRLSLGGCLSQTGNRISLKQDKHQVQNRVQEFDLHGQARAFISRHPGLEAHIRLLTPCLEALPGILTGKVLAAEIIFPNSNVDLVEGIYKGSSPVDYFNLRAADVVEAYVQARVKDLNAPGKAQQVRILEIGAGTGGTSAFIFERLKPYAPYLEYLYTDVSRSFLNYARDHYRRENSYIDLKIFDVEKPLAQQGIPGDYFDIVLAANVLHATGGIANTLDQVKAALKTNGLLVLNEITTVRHFTLLTFGLLEGWWLYRDSEVRLPGGPALSAENWTRMLRCHGFDPVEPVAAEAREWGQEVIVAESNGQAKQPRNIVETCLRRPGGSFEKPPVKHPDLPQNFLLGQADVWDNSAPVDIRHYIQREIARYVGEALGMNPAGINSKRSFSEYGVDSLIGIELVNKINEVFHITLKTTVLFDYPNLEDLAAYIQDNYSSSIKIPHDDAESTGDKNNQKFLRGGSRGGRFFQKESPPGRRGQEQQDDLMKLLKRLAAGELSAGEVEQRLQREPQHQCL